MMRHICEHCGNIMYYSKPLECYLCNDQMCLGFGKPVPAKEEKEAVNHPDHYTAGGMEVIDILKAKLTTEQLEGFLLGNVIKYTTRYGHKNGIEDLKKARWYLDYLIDSKLDLK